MIYSLESGELPPLNAMIPIQLSTKLNRENEYVHNIGEEDDSSSKFSSEYEDEKEEENVIRFDPSKNKIFKRIESPPRFPILANQPKRDESPKVVNIDLSKMVKPSLKEKLKKAQQDKIREANFSPANSQAFGTNSRSSREEGPSPRKLNISREEMKAAASSRLQHNQLLIERMKKERPISPMNSKGKKEPVTLALDLTRFKRKQKPEEPESILADLRKDISNLSMKMKSKTSFSPNRGNVASRYDIESTKQTNDSL